MISTPGPKHRGLAALTVAAVSAILLSGCAPGDPQPDESSAPVMGGTLIYATGDAEPTCLDPHVGGNYPQALLSTQYLESLVSKNTEGDILPWLASEWTTSDDGLTWEFTLRDDVTFTDGEPLTAEAVITNFEHLLDPETASSTGYLALGKISGTEAIDDHTLRVSLSSPDSALLDSLSMPWVAIQSPAALARTKEENCQTPVGTGPFTVQKWVKQDSVTLVRNDNYTSPPADAAHTGAPYLDGIHWRFIPDAASRYSALQAGTVDVIDNAQPDNLAGAPAAGITHIDAPRPGASNRIELNSGKAPFDDPRVREAFVRAADVDPGIEKMFFGTATRSHSVLSSVEKLGISDPSVFAVDSEEADRLLDEAGWDTTDSAGYRTKNGERLSLRFPVSTSQSIPAEQSLFQQVQAAVKKNGFEVILEPMDLSSWYGALAKNDYNLVSAPYTKVGPDVLRVIYHSDSIIPAPSGYYANLAQLSDPAIDRALTEAAAATDPAEREKLYNEAQHAILNGHYVLPLYDQQNHYLVGARAHGVRALPTVSAPTLYDAWVNG